MEIEKACKILAQVMNRTNTAEPRSFQKCHSISIRLGPKTGIFRPRRSDISAQTFQNGQPDLDNGWKWAGKWVLDFQDLTPAEIDTRMERGRREGFCAIRIDGGPGRVGPGGQEKKVVGKRRDFYREAKVMGDDWMSELYVLWRMLGWKEDLGFDGFLGEMEKCESQPEENALDLRAVIYRVGGEARDCKVSAYPTKSADRPQSDYP